MTVVAVAVVVVVVAVADKNRPPLFVVMKFSGREGATVLLPPSSS